MPVWCAYSSVIEITTGRNHSENTVTIISIVRPKDSVHDQNNARSRGAVIRLRFGFRMISMFIRLTKLNILFTTWMCHDELFDYYVILVI